MEMRLYKHVHERTSEPEWTEQLSRGYVKMVGMAADVGGRAMVV